MEGEVSVPEVNVEEVIQALRATRESDTNLSALQKLNRHVACPGGLYTLSRFLQRSPDLEEVTTIWAVQLSVKNVKVMTALLCLVNDLLRLGRPQAALNASGANGKWLSGDQTEECDESVRVMVDAFQERLAHFILQKKLKALYFMLTSDTRTLANAALSILGAIASLGPGLTRELVTAFDFSISALPILARPPNIKSSDTVDKVGGLSRDKYWKQWVHSKSVLSRPSRALFVDFACALLRSADQNMLSQLLMLRPLMGGLLCFLAGDPPSACLQVLQLLSSRVVQAQLPGSTAAPLPPRVCSEPFGDVAMQQLAELASESPNLGEEEEKEMMDAAAAGAAAEEEESDVYKKEKEEEEEDEEEKEEREEKEKGVKKELLDLARRKKKVAVLLTKAAVSKLAHDVLSHLCTNPQLGLAPYVQTADIGGGGLGLRSESGVKRILRLLPRLHPSGSIHHAQLLELIAWQQPGLASEYLAALTYDLEPKPSHHWLALMTVVGKMMVAKAGAQSPLMARIQTAVALSSNPAPRGASVGGGHSCPPVPSVSASTLSALLPSVDSGIVRSYLRCCMPSALSRACLSRGVQHSSAVVQVTALQVLQHMLDGMAPVVTAIQAAQQRWEAASSDDISEGALNDGDAASEQSPWTSLLNKMSTAVRMRLPEVQTLIALHGVLERQLQGAKPTASTQDGDASKTEEVVVSKTQKKKNKRKLEEMEAEAGEPEEAGDGSKGVASVLTAGVDQNADGVTAGGLDIADLQQQEADEDASEEAELDAFVFGVDGKVEDDDDFAGPGDDRSAHHKASTIMVALLQVLSSYCRLLPDAVADARLDMYKFIPQKILDASTGHQMALLDLLTAHTSDIALQADGRPSSSTGGTLTSGHLAPLLQLYVSSTSSAVRTAAYNLAAHHLRSSGLFHADMAEPLVWLWMLPTKVASQLSSSSTGPATHAESDTVVAFLCDTLVTLSRRPHETFELSMSLMPKDEASKHTASGSSFRPASAQLPPSFRPASASAVSMLAVPRVLRMKDTKGKAPSHGPRPAAHQSSLLFVAAVRSALKLLKSTKRSSASKSAIAAYIAGVAYELLQQQGNMTHMLTLLQSLLALESSSTSEPPSSDGQGGAGSDSDPMSITLPLEGRPLHSVHDWALGLLQRMGFSSGLRAIKFVFAAPAADAIGGGGGGGGDVSGGGGGGGGGDLVDGSASASQDLSIHLAALLEAVGNVFGLASLDGGDVANKRSSGHKESGKKKKKPRRDACLSPDQTHGLLTSMDRLALSLLQNPRADVLSAASKVAEALHAALEAEAEAEARTPSDRAAVGMALLSKLVTQLQAHALSLGKVATPTELPTLCSALISSLAYSESAAAGLEGEAQGTAASQGTAQCTAAHGITGSGYCSMLVGSETVSHAAAGSHILLEAVRSTLYCSAVSPSGVPSPTMDSLAASLAHCYPACVSPGTALLLGRGVSFWMSACSQPQFPLSLATSLVGSKSTKKAAKSTMSGEMMRLRIGFIALQNMVLPSSAQPVRSPSSSTSHQPHPSSPLPPKMHAQLACWLLSSPASPLVAALQPEVLKACGNPLSGKATEHGGMSSSTCVESSLKLLSQVVDAAHQPGLVVIDSAACGGTGSAKRMVLELCASHLDVVASIAEPLLLRAQPGQEDLMVAIIVLLPFIPRQKVASITTSLLQKAEAQVQGLQAGRPLEDAGAVGALEAEAASESLLEEKKKKKKDKKRASLAADPDLASSPAPASASLSPEEEADLSALLRLSCSSLKAAAVALGAPYTGHATLLGDHTDGYQQEGATQVASKSITTVGAAAAGGAGAGGDCSAIAKLSPTITTSTTTTTTRSTSATTVTTTYSSASVLTQSALAILSRAQTLLLDIFGSRHLPLVRMIGQNMELVHLRDFVLGRMLALAVAQGQTEGTAASSKTVDAVLDDKFLMIYLQRPTVSSSCILASLLPMSGKLHHSFASMLHAAVGKAAEAADQAGVQGEDSSTTRRHVLALLLPVARAYFAHASTSGMLLAEDDEVVSAYRDPLLAYAQQKKRKGSAAAAADDDGGASISHTDMVHSLHGHAITVLTSCLQCKPLGPEEKKKLLSKLLPTGGLLLEDVSSQPIAGAREQLALAIGILKEDKQNVNAESEGESALDAIFPCLNTAVLTLCAIYKTLATSGVLSGMQQSLEQDLITCLDGWIGDCLVDLPQELYTSDLFGRCCELVARLCSATMRYSGGRPQAVRCLRRLVAAIIPVNDEEEEEEVVEEEEEEMEEEKEKESKDRAMSTASGSSPEDSEDESEPDSMMMGGEESAQHHSDSDDPKEEESEDEGAATAKVVSGSDVESEEEDNTDVDMDTAGGDGTSPIELLKQLPALAQLPVVTNRTASTAASKMLVSLLSSASFLAAMEETYPSGAAPQAGPMLPELPPHVARISPPLQSILQLVAMPNPTASGQGSSTMVERSGPAAQPGSLRVEIIQLLEGLVDLRRTFDSEDLAEAALGASWPLPGSSDVTTLWGVLQMLQCSYGASMSLEDRATLRVMTMLDVLLLHATSSDPKVKDLDLMSARLSGPLAQSGYLWGAAAREYYEHLEEQQRVSPDSFKSPSLMQLEQQKARTQVLLKDGSVQIDARRTALSTSIAFPELRTLAADEDVITGPASILPCGREQYEAASRAAYDPAFVLLFSYCCLKDGGYSSVPLLLQWGLPPLFLRCLASPDIGMRAVAYECLGKLTPLLEGCEKVRERMQLSSLLAHVRNGVTRPFQRLPTVSAVFIAEAAVVLGQPGSPMYTLVNRAVLKKEALSPDDEIPLAPKLLLSGAPAHRVEQVWALQLLLLGLNDDAVDGSLYRRKFMVEVLMSMVMAQSFADSSLNVGGGSSLLGGGGTYLGGLTLAVIVRASALPKLAHHLVMLAGLIPWLTSVVLMYCSAGCSRTCSPTPSRQLHQSLLNQAGIALEALRHMALTRVGLAYAGGMHGEGELAQRSTGEDDHRQALRAAAPAATAYSLASLQLHALLTRLAVVGDDAPAAPAPIATLVPLSAPAPAGGVGCTITPSVTIQDMCVKLRETAEECAAAAVVLM